ncbi:hypothetical protein AVEN_73716-1 [Araneus ventricosus]|uniref:Uncharacterized protein n=1 Tax=Araneus ventricosus TaxID=182803 RepID=A0A4Y2HRB2_ARAVE|nr:hypothetical protein AVEN_73716-1 [Araneus ventricosus]
MKILGVILDDRLNGMAHINYLKDKTGKILNRLTIAKTRKGLSGRVPKALYKRGNEAADRAAKNASERRKIDTYLGAPLRPPRTSLRRLLLSEWQLRWDDDEAKGRFTHNIGRDVKTSRCIDNLYMSQIVSNHGLCPHYLKRFNLRNCNCRCG